MSQSVPNCRHFRPKKISAPYCRRNSSNLPFRRQKVTTVLPFMHFKLTFSDDFWATFCHRKVPFRLYKNFSENFNECLPKGK